LRLAFVIRLGSDTRPDEGLFEGRIEEVDSCTEVRFRSTSELLKFLGNRFNLATAPADKGRPHDCDQSLAGNKNLPTKKKAQEE
jgi:hypothetical protein